MRGARPKARVHWRALPSVDGARLMVAKDWSSSLAHYHENFDFCVLDAIRGDRGPRNHYRRWSYEGCERDVLLFEPGEHHRVAGGPVASYRVFSIPAEVLSNSTQAAARRPIHWRQAAAKDAYPYFERLAALADDAEAPPLAVQEALELALCHVVERCAEAFRPADGLDTTRTVTRTLEYIHEFLSNGSDRHLNLDDAVKYTGASSKYELCRAFKAVTRSTIYSTFKARKFSAAARVLVAKPRRPIQQVAWDFGYTPQCFVRGFRGFFGVSPREYRAAFSR